MFYIIIITTFNNYYYFNINHCCILIQYIFTLDAAVELDPSNIESRHPLTETLADLYPLFFLWMVTILYAILLLFDF